MRAFSDRYGDIHFLCGDCAQPIDAWMESFRSGLATKRSEPLLSQRAMCAGCFGDWCRAVHKREVKDFIDEARAQRAGLDTEAKRNER